MNSPKAMQTLDADHLAKVSDPRFKFSSLGVVSYEDGLAAQEKALQELELNSDLLGHVLALEHYPVVTLGKRGRASDDLKAQAQELAKMGIDLQISPRGGQATLHSPGQLIIYPCVHLGRLGLGVRDYVCVLEKSTRNFLAEIGIQTLESCGEPGVYTATGKIAFFGVRVSKGMASHGLSINVANDLSLFQLIRSCGRIAENFDRIQDHPEIQTEKQDLTGLFSLWSRHFLKALA